MSQNLPGLLAADLPPASLHLMSAAGRSDAAHAALQVPPQQDPQHALIFPCMHARGAV